MEGKLDPNTNPFEVRLERYVDLDIADDVVGIQALRRIKEEGVKRHQLGVLLDDFEPQPGPVRWYDIEVAGEKVGDMTCGCFSFVLERVIGFALIGVNHQPGDKVTVNRNGVRTTGTLCDLPFKKD